MERYYCNFPEEIVKLIGEYSSQEICVNYKYEICYIINECARCHCPIVFGCFDRCEKCRLRRFNIFQKWGVMLLQLEYNQRANQTARYGYRPRNRNRNRNINRYRYRNWIQG